MLRIKVSSIKYLVVSKTNKQFNEFNLYLNVKYFRLDMYPYSMYVRMFIDVWNSSVLIVTLTETCAVWTIKM